MKKNYLVPLIEVSEMTANAILAASDQTGYTGEGKPVNNISFGQGTVPSGQAAGAKASSNRLEF